MSTVAGLPKFVILKSQYEQKYLHYYWNDPSCGLYINYIGCKENLDPVNPFVKFEVVPSSSNPTQLVHLRCSYNNKFLQLDNKYPTCWVTATANGTDESTTRTTSTLFRPIFPAGRETHTVGFLHVQTNRHMRILFNAGFNAASVYSNDGDEMHRFEFAAWESYDEKIRKLVTAKDREIQQLRASNVVSMNANGEIRDLKSFYEEKLKANDGEMKKVEASYVEKMKAKDDEIKELRTKAKDDDNWCQQADDIIAELRLEIAELKVLLDDACRENDDLKEATGK